jgi:hypothetical protein
MASEADPSQDDRPSCPVHGRMSALLVPGCSIFCRCDPARWECPGFEGEGCAYKVTLYARIMGELKARMRLGGVL